MDNSVLKFLAEKGEGQARRASENQEVAKLFLGIISRCVVECQEKGKPIESVYFGDVAVIGTTLKSSVKFSSLVIGMNRASFMTTQYGDMKDYLGAKSGYMYLALKKNAAFTKLLTEMLDVVYAVCAQKGWNYRSVKVTKSFISKDGDIVAEFARA